MKKSHKQEDRTKERVAQSSLAVHVEASPLAEPGVVRPLAAQWDRVARRAYEIWEASGRFEGRDLDNWLRAEHDVAEVSSGGDVRGVEAGSPRNAP
ncbi:MAG: DUF2934 domain-containing protein [Acidobacteriota bacterium]